MIKFYSFAKNLKIFWIVLLIFLFFLPSIIKAESDICDIKNSEECQSSGEVQKYGGSEHGENCDKTIYLFYGKECSHCAEFERFLDSDILNNHPEIKVKKIEVWHNKENLDLMKRMLEEREIEAKVVPTVVVGDEVFAGYASDELTGVEIKQSIYNLYCIKDDVASKSLNIPFIGKVNFSNLSLPLITLVLGIVDGFNPCAMWALIALITILLATKDRKRIRLVGSIFLISSWLIYYFFIAIYLNTFMLLSFTALMRIIIGIVALVAGIFYIKDFFTYQAGVCKVTSPKHQKSIMERMKKIVVAKSTWLIIVGVIALAFSVNLIEMVCSIGLPVIYTQILSLSDLSKPLYYLYLALYNTLYMADDIIVFIIAAKTLQYVNLNYKYERAMKLVGGVLIITLGFVMLFYPKLLTF